MRLRLRRLLSVALFVASLAVAAPARAADQVTMDIAPAFDGFSPRFGTVPVAVEFRNNGPDTPVLLHVDSDQFHMIYPLELPRGSSKRLITYPSLGFASARYTAQTNSGFVVKNYEAPATLGDNSQTVLMICDTAGELSFLRGTKMVPHPSQNAPGSVLVPAPGGAPGTVVGPSSTQSVVQDAYTAPSIAPDRAVGYANLGAVVLGSGAERLRDEQVDALKAYAMVGGTLVFVGGASAPLLNDPRWQDILPAHDFHVATLDNSDALGQLGGAEAPRVSVMSGTPISGASIRREGRTLISAEREYGIGRVVFCSFNPFEAPLNHWDGRQSAMMRLIRPVDFLRTSHFLQTYSTNETAYTASGTSVTVYAGGGTSTSYSGSGASGVYPANDPFSIQLPPAESVFFLLVLYFLFVIPLNFLVLKKLKRGEAAWFSAPIISLGFAGIFFSRAHDLYSAKMSHATQGVVIAQEGSKQGMFIGRTQMFIPAGGAYDLKLSGVDSLNVVSTNNEMGYSQDRQQDMEAVDSGQIRVPAMPANNLSFREMSYRQYVPVGDWFSIEVTPDKQCRVRDTGPYRLRNAAVLVGNRTLSLGDLQPGDSKLVDLNRATKLPENFDPTGGFDQFLVRDRNVALTGQMNDLQPGPQIGASVPGRASINLALVAKEALGPR